MAQVLWVQLATRYLTQRYVAASGLEAGAMLSLSWALRAKALWWARLHHLGIFCTVMLQVRCGTLQWVDRAQCSCLCHGMHMHTKVH